MKIGRLTAKVRYAGERGGRGGQQLFVGRHRASLFGCSYWQVAPSPLTPRGVAARGLRSAERRSLSVSPLRAASSRVTSLAPAPASRLPRFHVRLSNQLRIAPGVHHGTDRSSRTNTYKFHSVSVQVHLSAC